VTAEVPLKCLDITLIPNGLVTSDVRKISFKISYANTSAGVVVTRTSLEYDIYNSDSKFTSLSNYCFNIGKRVEENLLKNESQ